jgi:HK97 family phage major capsid protein
MCGDRMGKPVGILHPSSNIPICDVAPSTPPGQFTAQDLIQLKFGLPEQYASRGTYLMNGQTLGLVMSMSDAMGRPIWLYPTPATDAGGFGNFMIAGSPVRVVSWMPDCQPGATPISFGDLEALYMIVTRQATTMQSDPYSMGFCTQFRFSVRAGGNTICPGAARLLRVL